MRRLLACGSLLLGLAAAAPAGAQPPRPAGAPDPCLAAPNRNEPDPLFGLGCATQANLRAMIANPADLERGVTPSRPGGDAAFDAARRLRLDQVKRPTDYANAGGNGGAQAQPNSSSR